MFVIKPENAWMIICVILSVPIVIAVIGLLIRSIRSNKLEHKSLPKGGDHSEYPALSSYEWEADHDF